VAQVAAAVFVNRQQRHATANPRLMLPVALVRTLAAIFKAVDEARPPLLRIK